MLRLSPASHLLPARSLQGGCVGYSNRFISGFYWVNILGVVAEAGWQQLNRQDLAGMSFTSSGSQYALVGPPGWVSGGGLVPPSPDYFTTVLWKALMGRTVLASTVAGGDAGAGGQLVAHVWCSAAAGAPPGAVTVAYANAFASEVTITAVGGESGAYPLTPRTEFFLTSAFCPHIRAPTLLLALLPSVACLRARVRPGQSIAAGPPRA